MFKLTILWGIIVLIIFLACTPTGAAIVKTADEVMYKSYILYHPEVTEGFWSKSEYGLIWYKFNVEYILVTDKKLGVKYEVCSYDFARKIVSGQLGIRQWNN